jgi:hypothetical protein
MIPGKRRTSPAHSDIKRGNAFEYADFTALRRVQNQNSIVGHQLSRAAVEEQEKQDWAISLISGASSAADTEFTSFYPMEEGTGLSGGQNSRLDRNHWSLGEDAFFLFVGSGEKFLQSLPAYRNFRVIRGGRHKGVVGGAGPYGRLKEAQKNRAKQEEGKNKPVHFFCKKRSYAEQSSKCDRKIYGSRGVPSWRVPPDPGVRRKVQRRAEVQLGQSRAPTQGGSLVSCPRNTSYFRGRTLALPIFVERS